MPLKLVDDIPDGGEPVDVINPCAANAIIMFNNTLDKLCNNKELQDGIGGVIMLIEIDNELFTENCNIKNAQEFIGRMELLKHTIIEKTHEG